MSAWLPVIDGALELATEVFKYINTKAARKYLDEVVKLKRKLLEEKSHGYLSDDVRIESLMAELEIIMAAAKQELEINKNRAQA